MPYPFKQIFAVDPNNLDMVAANAPVTIFAPGDLSRTPLPITDPTGASLSNPVITNDHGFGPAFIADIPQVAWEGGGFTGFMESYEGLLVEAVAARVSADASAQAAIDAAALVEAPAGDVVRSTIEADLSNPVSGISVVLGTSYASKETESEVEEGRLSETVLTDTIAGIANDRITAQAATVKASRDVVESAPLYSYGHSYTIKPSPYTSTDGEYQTRLAKRLNMGAVASRGRSGTLLMETFAMALSPKFDGTVRTWAPGSRGVALLENYMNEASGAIGSDPVFRSSWKQALRSTLALMSAKQKIEFAAFTTTGTWSQYAGAGIKPSFSNEDARFNAVVGSEARATVSGDECWIVSVAAVSTYNAGAIDVFVGSTKVGTIEPLGKLANYTNTVTGNQEPIAPMAYKITGLNAAAGTTGNKTVIMRVKETKNTFINCVLVPSATPPRIFVAKEPPRSPGATAGAPEFAANDPAYRAMVDEVVAEFPNAHSVDLAPGWNNNTMVASLDTVHKFHPNDLGMVHIADKFEGAIRQTITAPDPGVMTL